MPNEETTETKKKTVEKEEVNPPERVEKEKTTEKTTERTDDRPVTTEHQTQTF